MTSERPGGPREAFVWVWLPEAFEPVVAGRLYQVGDLLNFNYGRSYLAREDAVPLYLPELPLRPGEIEPGVGLDVAGAINDAGPDAWGQRVIMRHLIGAQADHADPAQLGALTYFLESGSDRIGALDFQTSPDRYLPRAETQATLEQLMLAAADFDAGRPLAPALDRALLHGSSVGGARPKALLDADRRKLIAKFSSSTDLFPIVKGEFIAMELARRAGLSVARVELDQVLGRDVLLVERFDRGPEDPRARRAMVSALTILGLGELSAGHASYAELAQIVRRRFRRAGPTNRELFSRITFNVLVGNTDDHARNHAAFWDGEMLELTPAFDICPQARNVGETSQGMAIGPGGFRLSLLRGCVEAAASYQLNEAEARAIIDHQVDVIESQWEDVADAAALSRPDREFFWHRQFLNPYAFEGYR
jgi:serine/threonine-protein kinase HipA